MTENSPGHCGKRKLLKIVVIGEGGVGKTSLLHRFASNSFDPHVCHTIGVECLKKDLRVCDEDFTVAIWDTAGQERFRSLRRPFYRGSDAVLLVFSLRSAASFSRLDFWLKEFRTNAGLGDTESDLPLVLVGNKADADVDEPREVRKEEAESWAAAHGLFPYVETSAKSGSNVAEAFATAIRSWQNLEGGKSLSEPEPPEGLVSLVRAPSRSLSPQTSETDSPTRKRCC